MNKNSKNKLAIVAGGSGGHILPALNIAKKWKNSNKESQILLFKSQRKIDSEIIANKDFIDKSIKLWIDKVPIKKTKIPILFLQLLYTFLHSFFVLLFFRPIKIITTGGLISIPVSFAAKMLRIKIDLYELNAVPGKASLIIARLANNVFITFQSTKKHFLPLLGSGAKCIFESYPTRFTKADLACSKDKILETLNKNISKLKFINNKKTIFILGGSQGSQYLNNFFKNWLLENESLLSKIQVIHQIGSFKENEFEMLYDSLKIPALTFSYNENIKDFYLLADLVISRAGAGTLFELEFFKKKALIIPLTTSTTDHQLINAQEIIKKNPGLFIMHRQNASQKELDLINRSIKKLLEI